VDRRNSFDLIRLLAAGTVLFSHSFPLSGHTAGEPLTRYTQYGTLGGIAVDTFFIISGYLVAGSYLRSSGPLEFLSKRALRLFPALWCAVFITVCVLGPILTPFPVSQYFAHAQTHEYLRNLFLDIRYSLPLVFASNPFPNAVNGSLWTLPLEALMYFLVMLLGVTKMLTFRGCAIVAAIFAGLHFLVPSTVFTDNGVVFHVMLYAELTRLGIFYFLGALFVFGPERWVKNNGLFWAMIAALLLFSRSSITEIITLVTLPYAVIAASHWRSRLADLVTRSGDYSYGVYVYAFPVQQTVVMLLAGHASSLIVFFYSLPITLILAYASWHVVESPSLGLKRFFFAPMNGLGPALVDTGKIGGQHISK
jgi:peptidoglycan/LPS O-acetylase OafA/YrhL